MTNNNKPLGYLFESVAYYKPSDLKNLIDNLTDEQSHYMIMKSLEYAHSKGLFNLTESEIVSKSLRLLSSKYLVKDDKPTEE